MRAPLIHRIEASPPRVGSIRFVGIDGHGGSGKSTLATLLSEQLQAEIIHTDDFAGIDNPTEWWPVVIERILSRSLQARKHSVTRVPAIGKLTALSQYVISL